MRRIAIIACLVFLPTFVGCTLPDALFAVFGGGYTGGGDTWADRQNHFNQQVEASRAYGARNP
jgi:hypothetical protein